LVESLCKSFQAGRGDAEEGNERERSDNYGMSRGRSVGTSIVVAKCLNFVVFSWKVR
jgi:hypothetical protein